MIAARLWPLTIAASIAATVAASGLPNPARAAIVFWFLLVCPGMAVAPLLGVGSRTTELTLGIAASLVLDTLVAEGMLLAKVWSPTAGVAILAAISLCGAALQLARIDPAEPRAGLDPAARD